MASCESPGRDSGHAWGQRQCLGGDLGEQVTFDVRFKGWLGIHRPDMVRDASRRFFQFVNSCMCLHTSFLSKEGPTAFFSIQGDL